MNNLYNSESRGWGLAAPSLAGIGSLGSFETVIVSPRPPRVEGTASSISDFRSLESDGPNLEELLYDARAQAKIDTSKVAMYLDIQWRKGLFRQLDSLLDVDEWLAGETPLRTSSFNTFLRLMLTLRSEIRPGLGLTSGGDLIASWQSGCARLTIECMPDDEIRYMLSSEIDGRTESSAGRSTVNRVGEILAPFKPQQWFMRDSAKPA